MNLVCTMNHHFKNGFISYLFQEYKNIENKTYRNDQEKNGGDFAAGKFETIEFDLNYTKYKMTLEEFKIKFKEWIEQELKAYILIDDEIIFENTCKNLVKIEEEKNIHPENKNTKPKTSFQLKYGNKYYFHNDKLHQIIWVKKIEETLYTKYIEQPSKKEKTLPIKVKFVIAKIQKPSGKCTEIKIPLSEFENRTYYINKNYLKGIIQNGKLV